MIRWGILTGVKDMTLHVGLMQLLAMGKCRLSRREAAQAPGVKRVGLQLPSNLREALTVQASAAGRRDFRKQGLVLFSHDLGRNWQR